VITYLTQIIDGAVGVADLGDGSYRVDFDGTGSRLATDAETLAAAQANHIEYLRAECEKSIVAGAQSDALGGPHRYPTDLKNQSNIMAQALRAQIFGAAKAPYKFLCADAHGVWARREHTAAQMIEAGSDVADHVINNQNQYELLSNQVKAITLSDGLETALTAISAITW